MHYDGHVQPCTWIHVELQRVTLKSLWTIEKRDWLEKRPIEMHVTGMTVQNCFQVIGWFWNILNCSTDEF